MAVLRDALPAGSAVSIVHATDLEPNKMSRFTARFGAAGIAFRPRDAAAFTELFGDWHVEPPGLVPPHRWHPAHPYAHLEPHIAGSLAGLAFKPHTPTTQSAEEKTS
ncbi:SAM-dependent methyltransferase [Streptomyces sp. NPDC059224]|uniref:SAM-dependent methyltransferase n=1 Tax=Streptomyces sp. NPDC059224 TaxID=3346775 RepID=UPI00367FD8CE